MNGEQSIQLSNPGKVRACAARRRRPGHIPEGVTTYTVTSTAGDAKFSLGSWHDLWAAVPGRLVLVTCFQLNDAGAPENYVVYAEATA